MTCTCKEPKTTSSNLKIFSPTICKVPATEKQEPRRSEFQVLAPARVCVRLNYCITKHISLLFFFFFYYSEAEINIYVYL